MGLRPLCRGALFGLVLLLGCWAGAKDRVGLFTGTFDPFHLGHRQVIETAIQLGELDFVYVIPNLDSPHKPKALAYPIRRHLTEVSLAGLQAARLPDTELENAMREARLNGLIAGLRARHTDSEFFQVMGQDSVDRYADDILSKIRNGFGLLLNLRDFRLTDLDLDTLPEEQLDILTHPRVVHLPLLGVNPSSTEIRSAFANGRLHPMIHPHAARLIIEMGLYGAKAELFCETSLMPVEEAS